MRAKTLPERIDMDPVIEDDAFENRSDNVAAIVPGIEPEEAGAGRAAIGGAEQIGMEDHARRPRARDIEFTGDQIVDALALSLIHI